VPLDESRHELFVGVEGSDGAELVLTEKAAVTLHIGTEDGGEFTFDFLGGQGASPKSCADKG
jgi:hypothetical protein